MYPPTATKRVILTVCECSPAPLQLLRMKMFACSPQRPSLAFDLDLLDFAHALHLRTTPNKTALAESLQEVLSSRGYLAPSDVCYLFHCRTKAHCFTQGSLRKRFENALLWYGQLKDQAQSMVTARINSYQTSTSSSPAPCDTANQLPSCNPSSTNLSRPSAYLTSRCALCFGGTGCSNENQRYAY